MSLGFSRCWRRNRRIFLFKNSRKQQWNIEKLCFQILLQSTAGHRSGANVGKCAVDKLTLRVILSSAKWQQRSTSPTRAPVVSSESLRNFSTRLLPMCDFSTPLRFVCACFVRAERRTAASPVRVSAPTKFLLLQVRQCGEREAPPADDKMRRLQTGPEGRDSRGTSVRRL